MKRYATRFSGAEVNATFYRLPRTQTLARWSLEVPEHFCFALKLPKTITHECRLVATDELLDVFLSGIQVLGAKLGPLLMQLPPSLEYSGDVADRFFRVLRSRHSGPVVCEPRNASWFGEEPNALMIEHRVSRVVADPPRNPEGESPGGWLELAYFRLHGSPRMYYSAYGESRLALVSERLKSTRSPETWCVFDNTASGAALQDALALAQIIPGGVRC